MPALKDLASRVAADALRAARGDLTAAEVLDELSDLLIGLLKAVHAEQQLLPFLAGQGVVVGAVGVVRADGLGAAMANMLGGAGDKGKGDVLVDLSHKLTECGILSVRETGMTAYLLLAGFEVQNHPDINLEVHGVLQLFLVLLVVTSIAAVASVTKSLAG